METLMSGHWHHLPSKEVTTLLGSNESKGLDEFEVGHRQNHFGPNRLTPTKGKNPVLLFLQQFHQPLIYILLGATAVTFLLQEWVDGGVILGVVLVNAVIGFIQEIKALKAIEALALTMEGSATVVRSGKKMQVTAADLIPGDLVLLQSGDKVPADLRLLRSKELQIDESALTGESVPVQKKLQELPVETVLAERCNMAYSSTLVTYGNGAGMVVAIGDSTEIGRINELISKAEELETPLTRRIADFSHILLWVILGLSVLTFLAGMLHGGSLLENFMASVALAVGSIPEGLPAAMTIMLAIGVEKMARRNAIIRKMPAVETLGSTTIICSDKTGTLTQNQMTVQKITVGEHSFQVNGTGYAPEGQILLNGQSFELTAHSQLRDCLLAGLLCNDSRLVPKGEQWHIEGDPTEAALIAAAAKAGLMQDEQERLLPRWDVLPFESQHQYMATLHTCPEDDCQVIYLKGSIESVLDRCHQSCETADGCEFFDKQAVHAQAEKMAAEGLRVLAFARKKVTGEGITSLTHEDVAEGLCFLGLQGMIDPPRAEAITAVDTCQRAGIEIKMITGDHAVTAAAVSRQIGLKGTGSDDHRDYSHTGRELADMSDQEIRQVAQDTVVFARVAPEQKLRLVEALQAEGHVVAMTGDGVNDAPALKKADIGVAMGNSGTEVAKEAADMLLTDDNFATIEAAVEEGRAVFDNLIKFITWTLPTNAGEGLVILVAILFGLALPITPVQILWINMTTALLLGLMLAFESKEPGIMDRPPREPDTPVLTQVLIVRISLVSLLLLIFSFSLFEWAELSGNSLANARTMAVNVFVFGEMFYLLNCRSLTHSMFRLGVFSNRWLIFGIITMTVLQIILTYVPVMNTLFGTAPISLLQWLTIIAGGLVIYVVVGLEKTWRRKRKRNP
ncbi:cation-translocating P-type ATPase [Syntrophotalea carbinolica DSM 2380]|uniref:Cation-translocating P-type ATPase n=1 Tax=Syntrophotalea carbinolica (strain DSM 2380 / NBRC 103641 / GraBd1) TaxID=338963 RepID=Q3A4V5_SYNC1|nr:cation-transporting P-type ATPase [Syntrophotalea carbinolica]ABA88602.1 cation-translocating P-type ATPase [Syntrophotalea carbinolica DSM 2380]